MEEYLDFFTALIVKRVWLIGTPGYVVGECQAISCQSDTVTGCLIVLMGVCTLLINFTLCWLTAIPAWMRDSNHYSYHNKNVSSLLMDWNNVSFAFNWYSSLVFIAFVCDIRQCKSTLVYFITMIDSWYIYILIYFYCNECNKIYLLSISWHSLHWNSELIHYHLLLQIFPSIKHIVCMYIFKE